MAHVNILTHVYSSVTMRHKLTRAPTCATSGAVATPATAGGRAGSRPPATRATGPTWPHSEHHLRTKKNNNAWIDARAHGRSAAHRSGRPTMSVATRPGARTGGQHTHHIIGNRQRCSRCRRACCGIARAVALAGRAAGFHQRPTTAAPPHSPTMRRTAQRLDPSVHAPRASGNRRLRRRHALQKKAGQLAERVVAGAPQRIIQELPQ